MMISSPDLNCTAAAREDFRTEVRGYPAAGPRKGRTRTKFGSAAAESLRLKGSFSLETTAPLGKDTTSATSTCSFLSLVDLDASGMQINTRSDATNAKGSA